MRIVGAALLGAALALASACSSSSRKSGTWCCAQLTLQDICICDANQTNCAGRKPSCQGTFSCCGITHENGGTSCSCAPDSFLQSINETCDEWFTSGGGNGRQPVSSCPPP